MPKDIEQTTPDIQAPTEPTQPTQTTEIRNPDAVLKALESERAARKELEKKFKAFEGIDPVKYQEYTAAEKRQQEEKEAAERKRLEEKGAYEALSAKQKEEHQRSLSAKDEQIVELQRQLAAKDEEIGNSKKQLSETKLHRKALKAFISEGGIEDDFDDFLWDKVKNNIVSTEDGGIQIVKDGHLWLDDKKQEMSLGGLFAHLRSGKAGKFFKPQSEAQGGGYVPQKGQAATVKTISREDASNPSALRKAGVSLEDIASGKVQVV